MFQPAPKRCFTIESLVAKDSPLPASRGEEPIRPAALSYANSNQMNPFLNGFHSSGRGVYSNPDLMFAEAVSHPPNSAVPVHPVPPPHALAAHPLSSSHNPHPLFASQQRDPSTFYPWLIHRYRYLGHRFQAKDSPLPASRGEEPIRPAALSYANSNQMNPFLNGFHSSGRGVYSNPDLMFTEAVSHPPNSAVPVHPVPPPHALAAHPLSSSHNPHPLFASQQRDPSTFYPWLIHRYRYLGHRFQGHETSPESFLLHNALARKPKRIRTAFSPSQLLRLEHAFEKNHYVVGAERKQLAHSLSLTETQVRFLFLQEWIC
ncbi:UNVERIFIED_CONTAM: hypothetical protein FKN15_015449 [Acipenser sinensis]